MTRSVLFVCTGNICRSPTADGIFRALNARHDLNLEIDSAGTHGYHIGNPPDSRAIQIAKARGIDMSYLRACKLEPDDFERFDLLIAMDNGHHATLSALAPREHAHKVALFLDALEGHEGGCVPDPYYGDIKGFEDVFDLIESGCEAWVRKLKAA